MEHTLLIICGVVAVLCFAAIYQRLAAAMAPPQPPVDVDVHVTVPPDAGAGGSFFPSYPYTNPGLGFFGGSSSSSRPADVVSNPYAPPLRDERYLVPSNGATMMPAAMAVNVPTNIGAVDAAFRQVGLLTPQNGPSKDAILQLMGRPLFVNRAKWQYYAISNQFNGAKLPVSVNGRGALTDSGADQLYSGESVFVEGTGATYKVTMYENETIRYMPFV